MSGPITDDRSVAMKSSSAVTPEPMRYLRFRWRRFTVVAGPGLVVMLADTDAGSVITAAQSGAEWGYRLLLLQLVLAPILYMVQELTVRLGIVSGKGHAELIGDHYGRGWAWLSVITLVVACIGALLSELSGLAGVGLLMGVPAPVTMVLVIGTLIGSLDNVQQIAEALTQYVGESTGKLLFVLGLSGSAMVATIVVTLPAARTLSEVLGVKHSLEHEPAEAPWFYGIYTATLTAGALLIVSGVNLVSLSVGVQVMNALLLPIVLGFLYLLARRLPNPYRLQGAYALIVAVVIAAAVIFGLYSGVLGLWG